MNKTIVITIIVIVVVIFGGLIIANQQKQASESKMQESKTMMHPSIQEKPTEVMKNGSESSMKMDETGTPSVMKPSGAMMHTENSTGSSMMENK